MTLYYESGRDIRVGDIFRVSETSNPQLWIVREIREDAHLDPIHWEYQGTADLFEDMNSPPMSRPTGWANPSGLYLYRRGEEVKKAMKKSGGFSSFIKKHDL
jgi:hypothetical protein